MTPRQVAGALRAPSYFEGPKSTLMALCILGLLAVLFLGIGYSRPAPANSSTDQRVSADRDLLLLAALNAPTAVYPSGAVKTGDPSTRAW